MTDQDIQQPGKMITLEHTYNASPEKIWQLWTTAEGIESWWAPDGFSVKVDKLELKPEGELIYTMTATAKPQIEFMQSAGMPLSTTSHKTFVALEPNKKISYNSLVDFVPGKDSYNFLTVVTLEPIDANTTKVVMQMEPLHDEEWTGRLAAGRQNELNNLDTVIRSAS
ncbi:MAG TPA: SRPBCC domain-containing protein [Candidatus Saccharimonadales bacterium]|nr:SRPBCC domain-containing protein [Candidatus Saccharimonadales bacterium]